MSGEAEVVTVEDEGEEEDNEDEASDDELQVVEEHIVPAITDNNPLNLPPRLQVGSLSCVPFDHRAPRRDCWPTCGQTT